MYTSYCRTFFLSPTKPTLLYVVVVGSKIILNSVPFCDFTHCRMVVSFRRLGTTYWFHLQGFWPLTIEYGANKLSQNVNKKLPFCAVWNSKKSADFSYTTAGAWSHAYFFFINTLFFASVRTYRSEHKVNIKFCVEMSKAATETLYLLREVCTDDRVIWRALTKWYETWKARMKRCVASSGN